MKKSITLIGTGWLGTHFLNKYHTLFSHIVTTSQSSKAHINSSDHFLIDIYTPQNPALPQTDICLITLPFSRQLTDPWAYPNGIEKLCQHLPKYKKVIFTSSTSIYAKKNDFVDESSPIETTQRAKALFETERLLMSIAESVYILRISGICGFSRNSKKKLQQKEVQGANHPVNLVHATDIIDVMYQLTLDQHAAKDIMNVSATDHPTKEDYYSYLCNAFNLPLPMFKPTQSSFKKISNKKLRTTYNINLTYPSPLTFTFDHE